MFCKKCGSEISDGTAFCPKCGAGQADAAITVSNGITAVANAANDKDALIAQMENSMQVMAAIKEKEDAIEATEEPIAKLEKKAKKGRVVVFSVVGLIIGSSFSSDSVFLALVFMVAFIGGSILAYKARTKNLSALKEQRNNDERTLETLKNDAVLQWLPYDYRDSTAFAYIYQYIVNLRADNLREAINLYENEKHQARLELISAISAQSAADAASAAKGAAASAAASAFFSLFK